MDGLEINGNAWPSADTAAGAIADTATGAPTVADSDYIVIKAYDFLGGAEQDRLKEKNNVDILEYLGEYAYLCGFKPKTQAELDAVKDHDFVKDAQVFHPDCVAEPELKDGSPEDNVEVEIGLHADISDADIDQVRGEIADIIGVSPDNVDIIDGEIKKVSIRREQLEPLARHDKVYTINGYAKPKLFNDMACDILKIRGSTVGPNATAYNGSGQSVFVCDTGFDSGDQVKHHEAFGDRVESLTSLGRLNTDQRTNDPDGHGTHVACSVLGSLTHSEGKLIAGPATGARLHVQSAFDKLYYDRDFDLWGGGLGGLEAFPPGIKLFTPAVTAKSFIHTNSWGTDGTSDRVSYTNDAWEIDAFAWRNPECVLLFAAGNEGSGPMNNLKYKAKTISREGTARNCITVGASESNRVVPGGSSSSSSSSLAASPNSIATFSSCGPTKPGRQIKPDIVAPGTKILSALSTGIDSRMKPRTDPTDKRFQFMNGTSMATPLVAGCVAVLREALLKDNTLEHPSSALIKALLVNGADRLADPTANPSTKADDFSTTTGFGRVNMNSTLAHVGKQASPPLAGFGERFGADALRHGSMSSFPFTVEVPAPAAGSNLSITLVWQDPPGAKLQHWLDLSVVHGSETKAWDVTKQPNNVQRITWKNASAGTYQATVKARQLLPQPPQSPTQPTESKEAFQSFAYVWRIY